MIMASDGQEMIHANEAILKKTYYCPVCQEHVFLKAGQIKMKHFAHQRGSQCVDAEPESVEHFLGKEQLFYWAKCQNYSPKYEVYFPEIKQRADLIFRINERPVAIEFQCSPLSIEQLDMRNKGYRQINIPVYWVLGAPYQNKQLSHAKISQFTQCFNNQPQILFWNTKIEQFEFYSYQHTDWMRSLARKTSAKKILIEQTKSIQTRLMTREVSLKPLVQMCYQQRHNLAGMPLVAHVAQSSWPWTKELETIWRVKVLLALERLPHSFSWTRSHWLEWLFGAVEDAWHSFPCLLNAQAMITVQVLQPFTHAMLEQNILKQNHDQILIAHHPRWFVSATEKLDYLQNKKA
ncbi:competence protein CoiA [Paucilactobacillus sp. N302-9]